ncbi:MAG: hypothetical protein R3A48_07135 [Polyangiales bacterium]
MAPPSASQTVAPYRSPCTRAAPAPQAPAVLTLDLLVVLVGLAVALLLRHWPSAIDAFSTQVLGFPSLRG